MLALEALAKFKEYLYKKNMKYTPEREIIFTEIFNRQGHFEADELARDLKSRGLGISRATVYRTLDVLYELDFVTRSTFGSRHQNYECCIGRKHHEHFICLECDKVIEFYDEELEKRKEEICKEHNFYMKKHTLQIFGYCSRQCKEKSEK